MSTEAHMDVRVGGSVRIIMHSPRGEYENTGEFTVIERPSKLAFTWTAKSIGPHPSLVTVEFLKITATETELVLTHERIPQSDVRAEYQSGWGQIADRLEQFFKGRQR